MDMNHGGEGSWWEGGAGWRGIKGRKKWDNYNSIINKIYFKKSAGHIIQYLLKKNRHMKKTY